MNPTTSRHTHSRATAFPGPRRTCLTFPTLPLSFSSTPLHSEEASVFDERKEAEMRLYSEKLARELALKKEREETDEPTETPETPLVQN